MAEVTLSEIASEYEDVARIGLTWVSANSDGVVDPTVDPRLAATIAHAQAAATLASSLRLADLTNKLGDYLGDDSNLDMLNRNVRDGLDEIRVALEGR